LGSVVVVKNGSPVGIVTDRDLVMGTLCSRLDPGALSIAEVASRPLVTIAQEAPVREAVQMIRRHAVRRLPVVDENGQLVGIVAADDLVPLLAGELSGLAVALRTQSPSGRISRDSSARGMNSTASRTPCSGRRQRSSASTATVRPVRRLTWGW
jgi:signal-transduction protein with cAMP-binding, CBS, and nucleotidyltransferase domain